MEFWHDSLNHPIDFSLLKNKKDIESAFSEKAGIIQKIVYDNAVIGYFVACKLDRNSLMKIKENIDTNLVFATFIPQDKKYSHEHIKLYAKNMIYNTGLRYIKKLVKQNTNNNDYISFESKINNNLSNLFFITQDNNYINNIVKHSKAFDDRLTRYYKNEKILVI